MKKLILCALVISGCSSYQPYGQPYGGYPNRSPYGQRGAGYEHGYNNKTFCVDSPDHYNEIGSSIGQIVSSFQSSGGYGSAYLIGSLVGSILDYQRPSNHDCVPRDDYSWDYPDGQPRDRRTPEEQHYQKYYDSYDSSWRGSDHEYDRPDDQDSF